MLKHTIYFTSRERERHGGGRVRVMEGGGWGVVGGELGSGHIGYNVRSLIFHRLFKGIVAIGSAETPRPMGVS